MNGAADGAGTDGSTLRGARGPAPPRSAAWPHPGRGSRWGWSRLGAERPLKTAVLLGLTVGICVPYFALQRFPVLPLREVPATALDGWIAFDPGWVYVYASIALLVPLLPLLATRREPLLRYACGLALLCAVCFAVFLVFPVEGPRPRAVPDHAVYALLISLDTRLNSMPSLHAGLVVYSLLFGRRLLRGDLGRGGRAAYAALALAWGAGILYATLATKQHWVLDLPAGMLVAWAAHRRAWRDAPADS